MGGDEGKTGRDGEREKKRGKKNCVEQKSGLHYTEEYLVPAAVALDQVKYQSQFQEIKLATRPCLIIRHQCRSHPTDLSMLGNRHDDVYQILGRSSKSHCYCSREKQVGQMKYPKAIYLFGGLSDQPFLFGFASLTPA